MGTNLAYIQRNLPHFQSLLVAEPHQAEDVELVVLTQTNPDFRQVLLDAPEETRVLDLAGATEPHKGYKTSLNRALMILQNLPVPFERGYGRPT